jgi:TMEM175 potassium channel family protein
MPVKLAPMRRPAATRSHYNLVAGQSLDRLAGLSDGIFAFAMTLLVLGLAVPSLAGISSETDLLNALVRLGPSVLTYTMSFLTLGIFWVGQQAQVGQLARSNRHYTWLQLALLASVTLIPFSTALLARFITYRVALVEYWLNIFILGMLMLAALEYGRRAALFRSEQQEGDVLHPRVAVRAMRNRILIAQSLYGGAALLCLVDTYVSITLIVLVQLNYAIAPRIPLLNRL